MSYPEFFAAVPRLTLFSTTRPTQPLVSRRRPYPGDTHGAQVVGGGTLVGRR